MRRLGCTDAVAFLSDLEFRERLNLGSLIPMSTGVPRGRSLVQPHRQTRIRVGACRGYVSLIGKYEYEHEDLRRYRTWLPKGRRDRYCVRLYVALFLDPDSTALTGLLRISSAPRYLIARAASDGCPPHAVTSFAVH